MEAGLSFAWRIPSSSLGRMVLGGLVATGLFAGAASVLHVRVPMVSLPTRQAAQVIAMGEEDEASRELLDWARFHSPFPDRWTPLGTGALQREMAGLTAELKASCAYQPRLLPQLDPPMSVRLPGLVDVELYPLPPVAVQPTILVRGEVAGQVEVVSAARGPLKARWGSERIAWGGEDRAALVGIEASFTVGVTPAGRVDFCLALEGAGPDIDEALKNWLRARKLPADPEAAGLVLDVVSIRFEAANPEPDAP